MLDALINRTGVTTAALHRNAQLAAEADPERRSGVEPLPLWWSASSAINVPFAINVLPLEAEIKHREPGSPIRYYSFKLEITFCVRGVVSPILSNLFLHYAFDTWMARTHPDLPWCRYADDGLVHCRSEQEAEALKADLQARLAECRLEMHPTKTTIVYCKDDKRKGKYPNVKFDFLGYCFRPRLVRRMRDNLLFGGFNPAVSPAALKTMRATIRDLNLRRQTQLSLQDIARKLNPLLRGWIGYYGRYVPSALYPLLRYVNQTLVAWAKRKFKRFKGCRTLAGHFLERLAAERPDLFAHWQLGMTGTFV
jgi:RNA-directed DNA polymerase